MASADTLSQAPAYPVKPIRWVVPFAPGASNDTLSRATALVMGPMLGQLFVVDNRPGAGAMIGAERLLGLCHALPTLRDSGAIARESAPSSYREAL